MAVEFIPQPDDRHLSRASSFGRPAPTARGTRGRRSRVPPRGGGDSSRTRGVRNASRSQRSVDRAASRRSLTGRTRPRGGNPSDRRKVILSTNVAETSVTIDGVVAGDRTAGLHALRRTRHGLAHAAAPRSAQPRLTGVGDPACRSGRTNAPGALHTTFTLAMTSTRVPEHEAPEIKRLDLVRRRCSRCVRSWSPRSPGLRLVRCSATGRACCGRRTSHPAWCAQFERGGDSPLAHVCCVSQSIRVSRE